MAREVDEVAARKAEAEKVREVARLQEIEDFIWLMRDRRGRRFIWRMLDRCGVYRTTFRTSSEMAFLEGQRNVGLMLVAEIHEHCQDEFLLMLKEAQVRE